MADQSLAVIILAAGQGTRMKSDLPKVLHPIGGRALIAHVLDAAASLEPTHILTVVRHDRERVANAILEHAPDTVIVDQDDVPGTGRAVEQAVHALPEGFDGTIVVLSGDVPLIDADALREMVANHTAGARAMTMLSAEFQNPTGLGRIVRAADGRVTAIVEEKDASDEQRAITEINGGVYAFSSRALAAALPHLDTNNAQREKYLTHAVDLILRAGGVVEALLISDTWLIHGVNDRAQLAQAGKELNARVIRRHQAAGVTIQDPDSTWIDADVAIANDVEILPGTFLHRATTIQRGAVIGPDTTLTGCEVGEGAHIRRSEATFAVFGPGAEVGPFSYIRAGTELGERGKLGAFVEAKNSQIGVGSKVPHLTYVGDVEIGDDSNIGAGTIVANYDGVEKHRSVVGNGVRVGSKNVLVSPVEIGDGAYTAAGTVVRKNVPSGSLGMSVSQQRNIEGWVAAQRPGSSSAEAAARASGSEQAAHETGEHE